jgi:hypothetical protein
MKDALIRTLRDPFFQQFVIPFAAGLLSIIAILSLIGNAMAHDNWVSKGGYKNKAGEWCCGDYDCKDHEQTASTPTGWMVGAELVPYDEALQGDGGKAIVPPNGSVTICRRPDGSRRCVFGVKPGG